MGETTHDFEGETVIVTGGSSGIGRAIARRFGAAGATVLVADVRETPRGETDRPTQEAITEEGGRAAFVETDVTDPDAVVPVVEAAREYGGVDVMVNNAGAYLDAPLVDVDLSDLDRLLAVNVKGVFVGCQAAARDMIDRGEGGRIINTASISSVNAQPGQTVYNATKGAVRMITRVGALELAEHGIRVNAVAPGIIATEFGSSGSEATERAVANNEQIKPVPLGRAGQPADVAGAALFIASDDAAYVTGEHVFVDGGYHIV